VRSIRLQARTARLLGLITRGSGAFVILRPDGAATSTRASILLDQVATQGRQ
jgi:hypothetical protein